MILLTTDYGMKHYYFWIPFCYVFSMRSFQLHIEWLDKLQTDPTGLLDDQMYRARMSNIKHAVMKAAIKSVLEN